ncbi:MAG: hypothetical protein HQK65_03485 [Desulfamplus sp.]|nr:hypothetical protein [Desulfamplus sp.]
MKGDIFKEKTGPVQDALIRANLEGVWVDYEWKGHNKHTYAKKIKGGLIVGSGYSE